MKAHWSSWPALLFHDHGILCFCIGIFPCSFDDFRVRNALNIADYILRHAVCVTAARARPLLWQRWEKALQAPQVTFHIHSTSFCWSREKSLSLSQGKESFALHALAELQNVYICVVQCLSSVTLVQTSMMHWSLSMKAIFVGK
jgi:hypothetical protein